MTAALAITGWCAAAALALELKRRAGLAADAAHELRGPLTALSLGLDTLRRQPAARGRAEALAVELTRIEAAADDVSAAGRGRRARSRARPLRLRDLVERCSDAWRPAAERRGGRVLIDWQAGCRTIRGDGGRLAQAFGNLLANAVEHGGGEIVVRGRSVEGGVRVEIEDRGPRPLAPVASARDASRARSPSRGRGLAIAARGLAQAGGRLEQVESRTGGRIAVAELPVDRAR